MKNLKEIPISYQKDIKKAVEILKSNGATEIFIFGSITNGKFNQNSDIDIAIKGIKEKEFYRVTSILMFELEHTIDIIDLDDKDDRFSQMLLENGNLIRIDNLL